MPIGVETKSGGGGTRTFFANKYGQKYFCWFSLPIPPYSITQFSSEINVLTHPPLYFFLLQYYYIARFNHLYLILYKVFVPIINHFSVLTNFCNLDILGR